MLKRLYQFLRRPLAHPSPTAGDGAAPVDPRETDLAYRNGYPPFPPAIIVSTERSGLNLIRHAVEFSAQRRTPGKTHILKEGPLAFHRTHWANASRISPGRTPVYGPSGRSFYSKCILLLRDPREILPRAYGNNLERMSDYADNIQAFHDFKGDKLLVIYDDLISDDRLFQDIFGFLDLGINLRLDQVPEIRSTSVAWYQKNQAKGGGSQTQGSPGALRQHQQQLNADQLDALLVLLNQRLGDLVPLYLGRWLA